MDLAILQWIQDNLRCGVLDTVMPAVTALGSGAALWLALAAVLLLRPQTRRTGWMLLGALALETVCCNLLLKPLVARPRPFALEPGIQLLIAPPGGFLLPVRAHGGRLCRSFGAVLWQKPPVAAGTGRRGADRVFPAVSVRPLPHRRAGPARSWASPVAGPCRRPPNGCGGPPGKRP